MIIPENHVNDTCLPGKGAETCAYLTLGGDGWECGKVSPGMKAAIDKRLQEETMNAQGDNCDGYGHPGLPIRD